MATLEMANGVSGMPVSFRIVRVFAVAAIFPCAGACDESARRAEPAPLVGASSAPSLAADVPEVTDSSADSSPQSCTALGCRRFDSLKGAMAPVLEEHARVIAFGEAHAKAGLPGVDSSAKRFTKEILPLFRGSAAGLLVELMLEPEGCGATTLEVRKRTDVVVKDQAASNKNEYVEMWRTARSLGISADLLHPSCKDFEAIAKAGDDSIFVTLETIARLSAADVKKRLASAPPERVILVYGGAIHGDPAPPPHRAKWSFAAELAPVVNGRYLSVGLFVREQIGVDAVWTSLAWYPYYDRGSAPGSVTMFHPRADSYVVIFPSTREDP